MADEHEQLRAALEASHAEQHELDEFISLLAHDLRTPLTSIRGYAQLLMRQRPGQPPLDPTLASGLQTIIEQSDRLSGLTNLLLDVSRVRLGRVALRRAEVDLTHAVRAVVSSWPEPGAIDEPEGMDAVLMASADSTRVQQMVRALLQYVTAREGGQSRVRLRLTPTPPDVALTIEDDGDVLDPEGAGKLFNQLVVPTSGTGGWRLAHPELFIVRGLAEAHGGGLEAVSPVPDSERGLRITLRLPAA
jgi:two-component system, OmpR family, sensor kinase